MAAAFAPAGSFDRAGKRQRAEHLLVFDFGGGTLDISVLRAGRGAGPPRALATGGIAIAGDRFDSRIVRGKLTAPFGEGRHYRSDGRSLPIPAAYYDAFASWQDLLALQAPNTLETLRRIARSVETPAGTRAQIRALLRLITSHYGLRPLRYRRSGQAPPFPRNARRIAFGRGRPAFGGAPDAPRIRAPDPAGLAAHRRAPG